jgi:hypothetical protein
MIYDYHPELNVVLRFLCAGYQKGSVGFKRRAVCITCKACLSGVSAIVIRCPPGSVHLRIFSHKAEIPEIRHPLRSW